ncbi:MAG: phosphatidate cytidylyltransferase [Elusimicrobiota bacterium]
MGQVLTSGKLATAALILVAGMTALRFTVAPRMPTLFPTTLVRLGWWWCLSLFVAAAVFFGKVPLLAGLGLASFLALKEYFTVIPSRQADRGAIWLSYLSIPFVLYYVWSGWYGMFVLTVPVYVFLLLPIVLAVRGERGGILLSLSRIGFGVMLLVYCLGYVGYLYVLDPRWFLTILLLTEFADQVQVPLSRFAGGAPLPVEEETGLHKSARGVLLSAALIIPACMALGPFNGWEPLHSLAVGTLIPLLSATGSLVVYSIRADIGIAGAGALVPGRGLMLDRMRALCYTAPVLFHYLRYFCT